MDEADYIQLAYPSEPDWGSVSDAVLIRLVQTHSDEPSCAASAICHLKARRHPQTESLCCDLLSGAKADPWLKADALGIFLNINPLLGFDKALNSIDDCEFELLEEIVVALNYEFQGDLSALVQSHQIVQRVKIRLLEHDPRLADYLPLFTERFGKY